MVLSSLQTLGAKSSKTHSKSGLPSADQIQNYLGSGEDKNINISYVWEDNPLGTIGSVSKIQNFQHDYVLISNSDLLTNLDYEHFFLEFLKQDADMAVATIPYQVNIPYAVLETKGNNILNFKEKPNHRR